MAYDSELRRFTLTTGTLPDSNISGVVYPDGRCVYRKYASAADALGTEVVTSITDLAAQYSSNTGYALTYTDPTGPDLVSVSPATAGTAGGDTLVGTGTGLNSSSIAVTLGGTACTTVRSNATTVSFVTPAKAAAVYPLVVTTAEGTDTLLAAVTVS